MENKRKIVNGEKVYTCEFTANDLAAIYNGLNRLYCQLDEKRENAGDSPAAELYEQMAEKVNQVIDKVHDISFC